VTTKSEWWPVRTNSHYIIIITPGSTVLLACSFSNSPIVPIRRLIALNASQELILCSNQIICHPGVTYAIYGVYLESQVYVQNIWAREKHNTYIYSTSLKIIVRDIGHKHRDSIRKPFFTSCVPNWLVIFPSVGHTTTTSACITHRVKTTLARVFIACSFPMSPSLFFYFSTFRDRWSSQFQIQSASL